jgi:tRNA-dihydrouridine synthase C
VSVNWKEFWSGSAPRIALAPMEGVVDAVVRDLFTRIGGIDLCVTEFIRVTDRLLPDTEFRKYAPELFSAIHPARTAAGVPVLPQLLGGQPGPMAENAARLASFGALGVDLNFGCPAKTVNRHDGGASLLKNPHRIHDVVSAVRGALPAHVPVSAKVRLGFENKDAHLEIAQAAESGGAAWLTVHARTRNEGYRPPAHWEYIARMREAVDITVIANGEIWNESDYRQALSVSGCRHAMIGRGLMSFPDLARIIKTSEAPASWTTVLNWVNDFAHASMEYRHEHYAVCRTKQWLKSLSKRYPEAEAAFDHIKRFENLQPILKTLEEITSASDRASAPDRVPQDPCIRPPADR